MEEFIISQRSYEPFNSDLYTYYNVQFRFHLNNDLELDDQNINFYKRSVFKNYYKRNKIFFNRGDILFHVTYDSRRIRLIKYFSRVLKYLKKYIKEENLITFWIYGNRLKSDNKEWIKINPDCVYDPIKQYVWIYDNNSNSRVIKKILKIDKMVVQINTYCFEKNLKIKTNF